MDTKTKPCRATLYIGRTPVNYLDSKNVRCGYQLIADSAGIIAKGRVPYAKDKGITWIVRKRGKSEKKVKGSME